jgi:hypothetical protein
MTLNFEVPTDDSYPFIATLAKNLQEVIWEKEFQVHLVEVAENYEDELEYLKKDLADLKDDRETDEVFKYLNYDEEDDTDKEPESNEFEIVKGVNPYTGESIRVKAKKYSKEERSAALAIVDDLIKEHEEVLIDPKARLATYLWDCQLNGHIPSSEEKRLLSHLESIAEYQGIVDSFHIFYGRDPENERLRDSHIAAWAKAETLAKDGDNSLLLELQRLSPEAEAAIAHGKRITKEPGDCYVCKKFILAFNGELLLWNEIPSEVRDSLMPGLRRKWHVRHFQPECSKDSLGKRIPVLHLRDHTGCKNEKADSCWVCGVQVEVDQGWLVHVSKIPKWKQAKRAFPGAKTKNYYVQCQETD